MSLRARLVLAFVLLGVVPLAAVTLYSYVASERAFRAAVEAEAGALANEMRQRMGTVTARLGDRMESLGHSVLAAEAARDDDFDAAQKEKLERDLERAAGDIADLIESLEVLPAPPDPPEGPGLEGAPPDAAAALRAGSPAGVARPRANERPRRDPDSRRRGGARLPRGGRGGRRRDHGRPEGGRPGRRSHRLGSARQRFTAEPPAWGRRPYNH